MAENLLSVGFNEQELDAQAKRVLKIVEDLHANLKKYENVKISPIDISGLQQLTASIKEQQGALSGLQSSVAKLSLAMDDMGKKTKIANTALSGTSKSAKDATNAINANTSATTKNTQAHINNGKKIAENDSSFKKLKQSVKDLEAALAESILNKDPKSVKEGLSAQLREANTAVNQVEESIRKAGSGGGMKEMGKALSENLSIVRNLAYILPGLGMAGIFNLAFEAITKAAEALGLFSTKMEKAIEYQNRLTEATNAYNNAISDQADALSQSDKLNVLYYENQLKLIQSQGASYEQQKEAIDNLNKAKKEAADATVQDLGATYEEAAKLNTQILSASNQRLVITEKILKTNEALKKKQAEPLQIQGIATTAVKKAGEVAGIEATLDFLNKELEVFDNQTSAAKKRYDDISGALVAQIAANTATQEEGLKRQKYYSEEERKIILSNAEKNIKTAMTASEMILDNQLSSEEERINALSAIAEQENAMADAKYQYVITNANATHAELIEAENTYAETSATIEKNRAKKTATVIRDFYLKRTEMIFLANEAEIRVTQLTQKKVYENEENSYEDRIEGLTKYIAARREANKQQYDKDLQVAKDTLPAEQFILKKRQLDAQRKANDADVENDIRKQSYDIAVSWFNKQVDLVKQQADLNESIQEDEATQELLKLNQQYANKEISFKEYQENLKKIEIKNRNEINAARVVDDKEELTRLQGLEQEAQNKLTGATVSAFMAPGSRSRGNLEGARANYEKARKLRIDSGKQLSKDQLKEQQDLNAGSIDLDKQHEDYIKQRNAAYAQLAEDGLNMIKDLTDQAFDARMEQIEEESEARQRALDLELEAIERSTISAKEKNAYEVQLNAQKMAMEEEAARKIRKLKHDQAVFDKEVAIAQIISGTAVAVVNALKVPGAGIGLAIAVGAMGAIELATALATKIPAYAQGGIHKGGDALFGEAGLEFVKQPDGRSWIADKPTIKHLPAGTELIPLYKIPSFPEKQNDSWAQTMYLGKQIQKSKREIKNIFKPKINIDISKQLYANRIIHG